jgi:hypothetical protein
MSYSDDDTRTERDPWDEREPPDRFKPRRGVPTSAVRSAVVAPGIALLVLAVFNLLGALGLLGLGAYLNSLDTQEFQEMMTEDDPGALDDVVNEGWTVEGFKQVYSYTVVILGVGGLVAAAVLGLGSLAMFAHKFYWLAIIAAVTAVLSPGGCFLFGLIGGIWTFIVLLNPEVRQSFT